MSVSRNLRFRFTLVSYNILSQTLLHDHSHLYNNCNPLDLEWPRRGNKIVKELMNDQADIICLQEVESDHLQSLYRPRLARYGYECLYKKKTGYKIDGCAIFYKSRLFSLLNYKGIEFNRTDVAYILNRDNVGIIAVLKPRIPTMSESSRLVIANTHLIFNPNRSDIKLAQLKFFLAELEAISSMQSCDSKPKAAAVASNSALESSSDQIQPETIQYYPTILCGDLNSTPDSDVSKYILKNTRFNSSSNGGNQPIDGQDLPHNGRNSSLGLADDSAPSPPMDGIETLQPPHSRQNSRFDESPRRSTTRGQLTHFDHSLKFKSVYPVHNKTGQRYVSTFSSEIVDYIFYTPQLRLESFKELLTEEQLESIGSLPNVDFPSDHITLGAKFTLK